MPVRREAAERGPHRRRSCADHLARRRSAPDARRAWRLPGAVLLTLLLVLPPSPPAAAQQRTPIVVDADELTFDDATQILEVTGHVSLTYFGNRVKADFVRVTVREQRLEARGHVAIVDTAGREIRGDTLTFDARRQAIELSSAEMIVNGLYLRSDHLRVAGGRIVAGESFLTTCDPKRPSFHLTASSIEVTPGDRAVVNGATLWVGGFGLLSVPTLVVSLRSQQETAGSFPSFGYTNVDGLYIAYKSAVLIVEPLVYASVLLGTLATRYDVGLLLPERPVGWLPFSVRGSVSTGWHKEVGTNTQTTRSQFTIWATTQAFQLGPSTDWQTSWNRQEVTYGTPAWQGVLRMQSAVTYRWAADTTLTLGRTILRVDCSPSATPCVPPLALDKIDPADLIDELRLELKKTGLQPDSLTTTTAKTGAFADNITNTTSVYAGYGERIANRYHWEFVPEYNLNTRAVTLNSDTGIALGTDAYFTVQAKYNTATTLFVDLDYIVTAQMSGCFQLSVEYRQMRSQLIIGLGLSPLSWATLPQPQAQGPRTYTCDS
jgi:lipopolysaccharide export system protein LptA